MCQAAISTRFLPQQQAKAQNKKSDNKNEILTC